MKPGKRILVLSIAALFLFTSGYLTQSKGAEVGEGLNAEKSVTLDELVVIAPPMEAPLVVTTDPKAPQQPIPADDGAGYLKNIPGFSVTRKGGSGGDPVFRGLGGTRLNMLLDGTYLQGGCGGRMDPPTSYIFPESYDKITILKGPQTVLWGGGNVAGSVLFERNTPRFEAPGVRAFGSVLYGSYNRNDEFLDVTGGIANGFLRVIGTRSDSDDYKDGDGNKVHSFYTRRSITGILGWTPTDHTKLEFTADGSDGEGAYADRTMDGVKFDRMGYSLRFQQTEISSLFTSLDAKVYYNYIDHLMDNYSLRPLTGMAMANNPDRETLGGRVATKMALLENTTANLGVDYLRNEHSLRTGTNYASKPRTPDMTFENIGVFAELEYDFNPKDRLIGGIRGDFLSVDNEKPGSLANDTNNMLGTFLRYEHDFGFAPLTSYIGVGRAERPADWWERNNYFFLDPEKSTQVDAGLIYTTAKLRTSLALFYAKIDNFILLTSTAAKARNIDATTYGGEADLAYSPFTNWIANATLAYVHGDNDTDHTPLAQMPPFEGRLGLRYDNKTWEAGILWRLVAPQDRVDVGNGTEIGKDIGKTGGFGVLYLNAAWRPLKNLLIAAGVDNLLDKTYAEHISKSVSPSVAAFGLEQTYKVNEPGRVFWARVSYRY